MDRTIEKAGTDGAPPAVTFADVLRFALRYGPAIVGIAVVGGILASLWLRATTPALYRAHATLVIERSTLGEAEPALREFETFRRILESDAVVSETRRRLVEAEVLGPDSGLRVGQALAVQTTTTKQVLGRSFTGLVPVLDLVVMMDEPDKAATTANLWAEVFLEHTHALLEGGQRSAVGSATAAIEGIGERIVAVEETGIEAWESLDAESARGHAKFDRREAALAREHGAALDAHEQATVALLEQAQEERPAASLEARREALERALAGAGSRPGEERDALASQLDATSAALRSAMLQRDAIANARERSFTALQEDQARQRLALARERRAFSTRIEFEQRTVEASIGREVEQLELLRRRLAEELAAAEVQALRLQDEPVRVVAPAVPPTRPEPKNSGARAAAFALGLALLGLLVALARDVLAGADRPAPRAS